MLLEIHQLHLSDVVTILFWLTINTAQPKTMSDEKGRWRNGWEDTTGGMQKEPWERRLIQVKDSTEERRSLIACDGKRLAYVLWLGMANLICRGPGMEACCTYRDTTTCKSSLKRSCFLVTEKQRWYGKSVIHIPASKNNSLRSGHSLKVSCITLTAKVLWK